jgi:hypothetical protein
LMKRIWIYVILFAGMMAVVEAVAQFRTASPRLVVEKTTYDLGDMTMGEVKKIKVRITNAGGDTLRILQVVPSCGCTTAKMPKSSLAGGESDVMELNFNSQGFKGKTTKHVTIVTNDPKSPSTVINFEANIISPLELVPYGPLAFFGNLPMGEQSARTIKIRNASKKPITIITISSSALGVDVRSARVTLRPDDTLAVPIKINPSKEGYNDGELVLETDNKTRPEVRFKLGFNGTMKKAM